MTIGAYAKSLTLSKQDNVVQTEKRFDVEQLATTPTSNRKSNLTSTHFFCFYISKYYLAGIGTISKKDFGRLPEFR
jgi:hypothetical protein